MAHRRRMPRAKLLFARQMRSHPTRAEAALWQVLRRDQVGVRFHRQSLIAGYIVDFYAPSQRLIVEVDGSIHDSPEARRKDAYRERVLTGLGYRVLRVTNTIVLGSIGDAVASVRAELSPDTDQRGRTCPKCGTVCATVPRVARHLRKYHSEVPRGSIDSARG